MMPKYSIVIPIKRYTYFWSKNGGIDTRENTAYHDNIKRFFEISWKTHDRNLVKHDIDCIYFIIPRDEADYFKSIMVQHIRDVKTMVVTEDQLVQSKFKFTSHRKQMLLKLLIAKYIKTELYLVLDDDIISLKTFGYNDLFSNKKIKYNGEININSQPQVWEASRDLLLLKQKTNIYRLKNVISITPEILITSVVNDMFAYLVSKHRSMQNLFEEMTKVSWTEYTLYWLYLRYVDKQGICHYYQMNNFTHANLTVYEDNYKTILKNALRDKSGYFTIIQSNVYEYNIPELKSALGV
jgi:hypothetical protein